MVDQGLNCVSRGARFFASIAALRTVINASSIASTASTLPGGLIEFIAVPAVNAVKIMTPLEAPMAALVDRWAA